MQSLIGPLTPSFRWQRGCLPFWSSDIANPERGQKTALTKHIYSGALLGEQKWVTKPQRNNVHAEFYPPGCTSYSRHGGNRFEYRIPRNNSVRLPERIDSTSLTNIYPVPEKITVDLRGLKIGDSVHISTIELPEGVLVTNIFVPSAIVCSKVDLIEHGDKEIK